MNVCLHKSCAHKDEECRRRGQLPPMEGPVEWDAVGLLLVIMSSGSGCVAVCRL